MHSKDKTAKKYGGGVPVVLLFGDDYQLFPVIEEGENEDDKWITVTGTGKQKHLLKPKPKPTLHNAFAILSQPDDPTNYNMSGPPLKHIESYWKTVEAFQQKQGALNHIKHRTRSIH